MRESDKGNSKPRGRLISSRSKTLGEREREHEGVSACRETRGLDSRASCLAPRLTRRSRNREAIRAAASKWSEIVQKSNLVR